MTITRRGLRSRSSTGPAHSGPIGLGDQNAIPLAIVGLSCRLPGTATSPEKLWDMLATGRSAWTSNAGNRFNMDQFYHPDIGKPGSVFRQPLYPCTRSC